MRHTHCETSRYYVTYMYMYVHTCILLLTYVCVHICTFGDFVHFYRYNHRNILSLVAYSNDGPRPCLIYDYMENGSLADCLSGRRPILLTWDVRLSIANQIADALHFLHTVNHPKCLVHGDVKRWASFGHLNVCVCVCVCV